MRNRVAQTAAFLVTKDILEMTIKVTTEGMVIPKELLQYLGEGEVEVRRENGFIVVIPKSKQYSIWDLGRNPVDCGVLDGSANHDQYIYSPNA